MILGLLTGGVLTGQSLIRAAELRSISTDYSRYVTATQSFRDKYMALPGDMPNATLFWGKDNTNCAAHTGTAATPGTCNGNGDGLAVFGATGNVLMTNESYQFWKQLALAGLIEGSYTGIAGPLAGFDTLLGTNAPASKLSSNIGWTISSTTVGTGNPQWFEGNYRNVLFFGRDANYTSDVALKPEEAWGIDTKIDDGKPATGKVRTWNNTFEPTCTDSNLLSSNYILTNTSIACALIFSTE